MTAFVLISVTITFKKNTFFLKHSNVLISLESYSSIMPLARITIIQPRVFEMSCALSIISVMLSGCCVLFQPDHFRSELVNLLF